MLAPWDADAARSIRRPGSTLLRARQTTSSTARSSPLDVVTCCPSAPTIRVRGPNRARNDGDWIAQQIGTVPSGVPCDR